MKKIRTNIKILIKDNKNILLLNAIILIIYTLSSLKGFKDIGVDIGIIGFNVSILSDHYYVLYGMLPLLILLIGNTIKKTNVYETIRYKNIYEQVKSTTKNILFFLLIYFSVHVLIISLIGMKDFSVIINNKLLPFDSYNETIILLNYFIKSFENDLIALLAIIIYIKFGFSVLSSLLSYVYYKYDKKSMMLWALIIYILNFIGFATNLKSSVPIFFYSNYILLHHSLFVNGNIKFILVVTTGILIILKSFNLIKKGKRFKYINFILPKREKNIALIFVLLILILQFIRNLGNADFNIRDLFLLSMFGTDENSVNFISWLGLTFFYMIPIFIIGISKSRIKKYDHTLLIVRFKNLKSFKTQMLMTYLRFIIVYIVFLFVIGNITFLLGHSTDLNTTYLIETYGISFNLEILNIYLLLFGLYTVMDFIFFSITSEFVGETASLIVMILMKFVFLFIPEVNILKFNYGFSDLLADLSLRNKFSIVFRFIILLIGILIINFYLRRTRNVNNKNKQHQ